MISVLLSLLLYVVAYFKGDFIRKYFNVILVVSIVLSIISFFTEFEIISKGFLGLAFFVVVMYGGAFKRQSKISKRIRSIRKEYSILGFVFLSVHGVMYLVETLTGEISYEWLGIIAYLFMIPLFITSFTKIKKKMKIKNWIKLQRFAYIAYLLTFIHLIIIGESEHIPVYIALFGFYSFLKLHNFVLVKLRNPQKVVVSLLVVVMCNLILLKATEFDVSAISFSSYQGVNYSDTELVDGIYKGTSTGYKGLPIELEVIVTNSVIEDISIIEDGSTGPHRGIDFRQSAILIAEEVILNQSTELDTIAGATSTTKGILEAVEDALN